MTHKFSNIGVILLLATLALNSFACSSKDLSRSMAQSMIEASPAYKEASSFSLVDAYNEQVPLGINRVSAEETVDQARLRVLARQLEWKPETAAAHHLGLVNLTADFIKERKPVMGLKAEWEFKVMARANDKGKALWKAYKLPETDEFLPLAKKQIIEITGITKQGETQAAADFTYKWIPNELGKTLDPKTEEFKRLPEAIQKDLTGKGKESDMDKSIDWSGERRGKALFQKYDDGWRLVDVRF